MKTLGKRENAQKEHAGGDTTLKSPHQSCRGFRWHLLKRAWVVIGKCSTLSSEEATDLKYQDLGNFVEPMWPKYEKKKKNKLEDFSAKFKN